MQVHAEVKLLISIYIVAVRVLRRVLRECRAIVSDRHLGPADPKVGAVLEK